MGLIDKPANVHNIKPIIVVWFKDNWWSQDNRRLAAFCLAGLTEIPVQIGTVTYKFVDHKSTKPYQDGVNKVVNNEADGASRLQVVIFAIICVAAFVHLELTSLR